MLRGYNLEKLSRPKAGVCGIRTDWSGICGGPGWLAGWLGVRSGELLLHGLFRAQRALCGGGAALALQPVATRQRDRALLPAGHTALPLLPVHHLDRQKGMLTPPTGGEERASQGTNA